MDISAALAADLAILTQALDQRDVDLQTQVQALSDDVSSAVVSYLGLRMAIAVGGQDVSIALRSDTTTGPEVATSLLIPLAAVTDAEPASALVLYAGVPGAFVDLAADLAHALNLDPISLALDEHLHRPSDGASGAAGLDWHSAINQAIGILIGRGRTPEAALEELQRLARLDGNNLHHSAAALILGISVPTPLSDEV